MIPCTCTVTLTPGPLREVVRGAGWQRRARLRRVCARAAGALRVPTAARVRPPRVEPGQGLSSRGRRRESERARATSQPAEGWGGSERESGREGGRGRKLQGGRVSARPPGGAHTLPRPSTPGRTPGPGRAHVSERGQGGKTFDAHLLFTCGSGRFATRRQWPRRRK